MLVKQRLEQKSADRPVTVWRPLSESTRWDRSRRRFVLFTLTGRWNPIRGLAEVALCGALLFDGADEAEALGKAQTYLQTYFPQARAAA